MRLAALVSFLVLSGLILGGWLAVESRTADAQVPEASLTIIKDTNPETDDTLFDFDSPELGDFDLTDDESITFDELDPDTYTITENPGSAWDLVAISCDTENIEVSLILERVVVELEDGDDVTCIFTNEGVDDDDDDDVDVDPTPVAPAQMFINANAFVSCNQSINVTVNVFAGGGVPVGNGTPVTFSATDGDFSQSNVMTTFSGGVQVTYDAPDEEGLVTITARSGSLSAAKQVTVICADEPAPPPTPKPVTVKPPATGDGGLSGSSDSTLAYLLLGGIAATVGGAAWIARRRVS